MRGLLRLYVPPLPRSVFTLQAGGLVNAFGNGMVVPFMFIYLHNVRGIGLGVAGLVIATHAVFSIVTGPIFGSQIDRFGGKRMLALSLVILSVGYASYSLVQPRGRAFSSPSSAARASADSGHRSRRSSRGSRRASSAPPRSRCSGSS